MDTDAPSTMSMPVSGYSDDDFLIAPSLTALKGMMTISDELFNEHGLSFSTDPIPAKSKTKFIAWLIEKRDLPEMRLAGNLLPWVSQVKHLGMTLTDEKNILEKDLAIKRANILPKM